MCPWLRVLSTSVNVRAHSYTDVMDEELRQSLTAMESRLIELVTGVKESLEREIRTGFDAVKSRFDIQAARLDRQAALIQTGSRWTNRMNDWAEKVDVAPDQKSEEIAELRGRLEKLEGRSN